MAIIKILPHPEYCPQGAEVSAPAGTSVCEALLDNGINIEHACDLSCACTTCHVIVREGFKSLGEMDESEEDLLDRAWGLQPNSRLSCQAIVAQQDLGGGHAHQLGIGEQPGPTASGPVRRRDHVIVQMDVECCQKGVKVGRHTLILDALRHARSSFRNFPSTI